MKKNYSAWHIFVLCMLLFIVSPQDAMSINYARNGEATVYVGETTTIELTTAYKNTINKATIYSLSWESENTNYVKVTSHTNTSATVRGIAETSSAIKVKFTCYYKYGKGNSSQSAHLYYDVTVKSRTVKVGNIILNKSNETLEVGKTLQLKAEVYPTNATNKSVVWSSTNKSVATVSSSGKVTAKSAGSAKIKCTPEDGSNVTTVCNITVVPASIYSSINLPVNVANKGETEDIAYLGTAFVDFPISLSSLTSQGVTAYTASLDTEGSSVSLKKITGGYIPKSTGIILGSNEKKDKVELKYLNTGTTATVTGNLLVGTVKNKEIFNDGATYYILTKPDDEDEGGFYYQNRSYWEGTSLEGKDAGTGVVCYKNKAALRVPGSSAGAKLAITFNDGNVATAIGGLKDKGNDDNSLYNLQGQKMNPTGKLQRGIYIRNGKKVLVK